MSTTSTHLSAYSLGDCSLLTFMEAVHVCHTIKSVHNIYDEQASLRGDEIMRKY